MKNTEYLKLPLYQDSEAPDISSTGHYNAAMEILDTKGRELSEDIADEREARIAGDSALEEKLAAETAAREAADTALEGKVATKADATDVTALGKRVDNAEVEISANSADLTGIKGLTYGTGGQVFLENENGSYSSPALEEIQHEISDLKGQSGGTEVNIISPQVVDTLPVSNTSNGIAVGGGARTWVDGIALGNYSAASASGAIAIGSGTSRNYAEANKNGSVAIGFYSLANTVNSVALGSNSRTDYDNVVSVGNPVTHFTRRITNVTDPTGAQDAATKNYVDTAIAGVSGGSGVTVIDLGDSLAADVYAKVQAAWPNCVLFGANYMYPAQHTVDGSYLFSTVAAGIMYVCMVTSTDVQTAYTHVVLPDTTFGALTSGVTS